MLWSAGDLKQAIDDSDAEFAVFLRKLPRGEIERLMCAPSHWRTVVARFDITSGEAARMIYDEIRSRARWGRA